MYFYNFSKYWNHGQKINKVLAGIYLSNSAVQQAFHDKRLHDSSFIYVMSGLPKECKYLDVSI